MVSSLNNFVKSFEDFRRHVRRKIIELSLLPLHRPIRWERIRIIAVIGSCLIITDFLEVTKEIVPFIVALVLATKTPMSPTVVLHPFPPEFARFRSGSGGAGFRTSLVVKFLGCYKG